MLKETLINNECEARAMISESQYKEIYNHFSSINLRKRLVRNTNYYFDDDKGNIINSGMVLRLREINHQKYELTLKIKEENNDKEFNLPIYIKNIDEYLKNFKIDNKYIIEELKKRNIDITKIKYLTYLFTERLEVKYKNFLLVVDKNEYNGIIDYNVEIEARSREEAISILNQKFSPFGVTYKKGYISKSRRAYLSI